MAGSGATGEMLSAPEWMLPRKPRPEHASEQQKPARLLWGLAQVLQAASPGHFGCCWQSSRLPKHAAGSASGRGWKSQQCSQSVRDALSKLPWRLPDPLHGRKSGTSSPVGRPKQFVPLTRAPHSPAFLCQARQRASLCCRLVPMHTLLWDQSRAGCKPPSRRYPFIPLHTVP